MTQRFLPEKNFLINWCKALMLSPGVLFPAAYLLVYTSINIYLNAEFKKNLAQSIKQATGSTWEISIKSLSSDLILDSVTLNHIELTPAGTMEHPSITIPTIEVDCPDLQKVLFSPAKRLSSTEVICEKILSDRHLVQ
ncbi:MAG: hypothetical protein JZU70_11915 [Chlorobium sp.]|jgi:hypothetical protein|nr:hypothetical protein [Chlorobium sp.]